MTLLELLMALFLFATLVPLFAGLWSTHHRAVRKSLNVVAATNICNLILEQAVGAGYAGVDAMAATTLADRTLTLRTTTVDSSQGAPTTNLQDETYIWNMTVQGPADDPSIRVGEKLVRVEVEWEERGATQQVDASTLLVTSP